MYSEDVLPKFKHINSDIGLKFLNYNQKLYLKILNSFLERYEYLDIISLESSELDDVLHTIKGLSATLGMEQLHSLTMRELTNDSKEKLQENLTLVIAELKNELRIEQHK
jgi:HPt (histidine-containing phosphotransfer) domain-containing protein